MSAADGAHELERWMREFGGERAFVAGPAGRAEAGIRALTAAMSRTGRDREGAFALLAADGLITSAVQELADTDDPEAGFRELVGALATVWAEQEG